MTGCRARERFLVARTFWNTKELSEKAFKRTGARVFPKSLAASCFSSSQNEHQHQSNPFITMIPSISFLFGLALLLWLAIWKRRTSAWNMNYSARSRSCFSRRAILERAKAGTAGLFIATLTEKPAPAFAVDETVAGVAVTGGDVNVDASVATGGQASDKAKEQAREADKRRKAEEKEARRIAEETKKRLAAGRIGRI
jgi:hypothetical protein